MRTNYRRRSLVNLDGYKDDSANRDNPVNIIPSNNITMEGVSFPIRATPVKDGVTKGTQTLYPGQDYKFPGADYVIEEKFQQGGEMNKFDKYFTGKSFQKGGFNYNVDFNPDDYKLNLQPTDPYAMFQQQGQQDPGSAPNLNAFQPQQGTIGNSSFGGAPTQEQPNSTVDTNTPQPAEEPYNQGMETYQFHNPYGGVDTEGAAVALGQGIANGNIASIIGGAGKIGLSMWRNISGGHAEAKRKNRDRNSYYEKQRQQRAVDPNKTQIMKLGGNINKFDKYF